MIQTTYLKNNTLVQHYSDAGFLLLQNETGIKYADPVDLVPCRYTYTETNEPIDEETDPNLATESDYQSALNTFGVIL